MLPQPLLRDSYDEHGLKPPKGLAENLFWNDMVTGILLQLNPFGWIGDELWVRETWSPLSGLDPGHEGVVFFDGAQKFKDGNYYPPQEKYGPGAFDHIKWKPSIHMHRWASRIQLVILGVRAERIQDITDEEILAEGIPPKWGDGKWHSMRFPKLTKEIWNSKTSRQQWEYCWNSINAERGFGWDVNPWVWVIHFRRMRPK